MVKEVVGDIFTDVQVIAHQTNHEGVMVGGFAKEVRDRFFTEEVFSAYKEKCMFQRDLLTGTNEVCETQGSDSVKYVVNMFAQNSKPVHVDGRREFTNYMALRMCLEDLRDNPKFVGLKIGIPAFIGCVLAGGDWVTVYQIIQEVFGEASTDIWIYYLSEEDYDKSESILKMKDVEKETDLSDPSFEESITSEEKEEVDLFIKKFRNLFSH